MAVKFTATDQEAVKTDVPEDTHLATYTPGKKKEKKDNLEVPRIGIRFHIPQDMNIVEYFGRGPEENYIDRNAGSMVGRYKTMVVRKKTDIVQMRVGLSCQIRADVVCWYRQIRLLVLMH